MTKIIKTSELFKMNEEEQKDFCDKLGFETNGDYYFKDDFKESLFIPFEEWLNENINSNGDECEPHSFKKLKQFCEIKKFNFEYIRLCCVVTYDINCDCELILKM